VLSCPVWYFENKDNAFSMEGATMDNSTTLKRPVTFTEDGEYYWKESKDETGIYKLTRVWFVEYHPSPAFVIVSDEQGQKRLCPRDELFCLEAYSS
jgi:hypothetical protein